MRLRWWKRWLLGIAVVLVGVYAAAIFLAHRTPPLSISQGTSNVGENAYLIGVDLDNTGLFPVTLLRARVEPVREARITAVVSLEDPGGNSICQASSAALYPDGCPHSGRERWPVGGSRRRGPAARCTGCGSNSPWKRGRRNRSWWCPIGTSGGPSRMSARSVLAREGVKGNPAGLQSSYHCRRPGAGRPGQR